MSTRREAVTPPSDVNHPSVRTNVDEDRSRESPGRGTREDGSGAQTPLER